MSTPFISTGDMTTIAHLDLPRYLGTWYEICRLPMKWEDATARDITATYSLNPDGTIKVDNRCIDAEGNPAQSIGVATPQDETNAKLSVSFLPEFLRWIPFTKGDYWVLKLDPDYRIALVGEPSRDYLWLLAREPHLETREETPFLETAVELGYDLSKLIRPQQSGGQVSDEMLEARKAGG